MNRTDNIPDVQALHLEVKKLLMEGKAESEIIEIYTKKGFEAYYIETVIANLEDDEEDRKSFRSSMIMGLFYLASGGALTIMSFLYSERVSAFYFYVFYGLIVLGIVTIVRGFILYKK